MLRNPKPETEFRRINDRLALYHLAQDQNGYWADYWDSFDFQSLHSSPGLSALGELTPVFERYLRPGGLILEAGCGAGRIVAAIAAEGFQVIGIERSEQVVAAVNAQASFLDVRQGDVEDLPLPDSSLDAYVSLGVVEHFEDGPQTALTEAARVLKPGGWAFVSVPYLNPRRARFLRGLGSAAVREDLSFHQYYFSREEIDRSLNQVGLIVNDHVPYSVEAFLVREHPVSSAFWGSMFCREKLKGILRPWFGGAGSRSRWSYGHMILAVSQKVQ